MANKEVIVVQTATRQEPVTCELETVGEAKPPVEAEIGGVDDAQCEWPAGKLRAARHGAFTVLLYEAGRTHIAP